MSMNRILMKAVGIVFMFSLLFASNAVFAQIESEGVIHSVFLWLKKPGDEQHMQRLLHATHRLRAIPGVLDIHFGEKIESDRDIVDDSFDIGITMYFSSTEAMNEYLVHPLHHAVVEQEIRPLVDRIVVHDFSRVSIR
jgi:hypothetical protein